MATWIFLRGLTRESRHWGAFLGTFGAAFPLDTVVALDLPGNGLLNHLRSPTQVADMVAHCRLQLAQRGVPGPYHVLAMSLGAMVSVAWAHQCPDELAGQVLINTSLAPFSPFYQRLRPANYPLLLRLLLGASDAQWERAILTLTSNRADATVLAFWVTLRRSHPVARRNALRQLLAAARFGAPRRAPAVPTLLMASEQDHLVSVACSQTLARQWQCPLRLHPSAGHDLPLDDGPWVTGVIRQWLSESV